MYANPSNEGDQGTSPALEVYATTQLDVVDAYLVAVVEQRKQATIVSFDKGFDRWPGITREEP